VLCSMSGALSVNANSKIIGADAAHDFTSSRKRGLDKALTSIRT
jgi:hypothetical protein